MAKKQNATLFADFINVGRGKLAGFPSVFSECRKYRFVLWRSWGVDELLFNRDYVAFIGLNPSTADDVVDDNTIRRCIAFTKRLNRDAMVMLNLWPLRSTDPAGLKQPGGRLHVDANDQWIIHLTRGAAVTVCCWGDHGKIDDRGRDVVKMLRDVEVEPLCFGLTIGKKQPKHPLYLPADQPLVAIDREADLD